jgi:uncharacterized protein YndB with AHSA1/START domain
VTYRAEQDFSAPPEVVFNVVTDPDRLPRWLPSQLRVADTGERCLRVQWTDPPTGVPEYRLLVLPDRLRVEWRPNGPDGWSGFIQVRQGPAGGATAEVCVAPTGQPGGNQAADRVPGILETSLANLGSEVADNLTAG